MVRGLASLRCLAALSVLLLGTALAQPVTTSGQYGSSFPGACPISKLSDVIVTVVATQPESTTGPLSVRPSNPFNFTYIRTQCLILHCCPHSLN